MSKLIGFLTRLRRTLHRREFERRMADEMREHLAHETARRVAAGEDPVTARRCAAVEFGHVDSLKEQVRDGRFGASLETFGRDVRQAARSLRKSPGFTIIAVVSLALGIGANTAIFSFLNAILLRALPVPDPQELRVIHWTGSSYSFSGFSGAVSQRDGRHVSGTFSAATFHDFRDRAADVAGVFAFFPLANLATQTPGGAGLSHALMVSGNFFGDYRAHTLLGRTLTPEDDRAGAKPAAVITHRFWEQCLGRDPDALNQTLGINGHQFAIVGVLPPDYAGPITGVSADVYVPMAAQPQLVPGQSLTSYDRWWVQMMARVPPGVSDAQLQAVLAASFAQTFEQGKTRIEQPEIVLDDGRRGIVMHREKVTPILFGLQAMVTTVLLIACANLAGLMLARASARRREFAVRAAIGAGRWRLMRQLLVESLLLAGGGAVVGLLLAAWIKGALLGLVPGFVGDLLLDTGTDGRVLLFTVMLMLATALLCGLLPARRAARVDPLVDLQSGRAGSFTRQRLGRVLVAMQVALSVVLMAGAGLFVRSMTNLRAIDPGFDAENLVLFHLEAHRYGYSEQRRGEFFARVGEELRRLPGITAVASADHRLATGYMSSTGFSIPDREPGSGERRQAHRLVVSDGYFRTLGILLQQGRDFAASDSQDSVPVVILNELFARRHFPDEDPLGRTVTVGRTDYRVIGVCGTALYTDVKSEKPVTMYLSSRQRIPHGMDFALRSVLPPASIVPAARDVIAAIDASIPMVDVTTQEEQFNRSLFLERLFAGLCGVLGSLAVLLSCIGLYGLLAYNVVRRTSEIGVRMALGARPADVARAFVREAWGMTAWGLAIGLPLAIALGFVARGAFYGVTPYDPVTMTSAVAGLLVAATFAAWLPAQRAARVDPLTALRSE